MSDRNGEWAIRHILVALDGSRHSLAAMEAAVGLAASLESELVGLFVEDVSLLRAAEAPGAGELKYPATAAALDRSRMERHLQAQGSRVQRVLSRTCRAHGVPWTFRTARGQVIAEVLNAATEADLLCLGKRGRPLLGRARPGSTALMAAAQAPSSVLLLTQEGPLAPPVMVTFDGSPVSRQALALSAHLAEVLGQALTVILVADEETPPIQELQIQAARLLQQRELVPTYRRLIDRRVENLIHSVVAEGTGTLVLDASLFEPTSFSQLVAGVACPILVMR